MAANGLAFCWPLRLTFLGRREEPVKEGYMSLASLEGVYARDRGRTAWAHHRRALRRWRRWRGAGLSPGLLECSLGQSVSVGLVTPEAGWRGSRSAGRPLTDADGVLIGEGRSRAQRPAVQPLLIHAMERLLTSSVSQFTPHKSLGGGAPSGGPCTAAAAIAISSPAQPPAAPV